MGQGLIRAFLALVALSCTTVQAQDVRTFVPSGAQQYAPILAQVQREAWPEAFEAFTIAGQVEQESCISLKHSKCWNPKAELKTPREYGFGFGQLTVAYRADGSERFNKFDEVKTLYPSLRGWSWADRYRADYQLQSIVLLDRTLFGQFADAASPTDRWAFTLAAYNGGKGGTMQDRVLCRNSKACDPRVWFGNVELTSLKTRQVNPGYGKSAFDINREYPRLILLVRRDKYKSFWSAP